MLFANQARKTWIDLLNLSREDERVVNISPTRACHKILISGTH
jgi:hypothetical protein